MHLILALLIMSPLFAQSDLEYYVQRFNYQALELPAKRSALYDLGERLFQRE